MQHTELQPEDRYYITETCYVLLSKRELVNLNSSCKLKGLIWKFLNCLMERHDSIVSYDEICEKLWPNKESGLNDITQIMYRLRHQCFDAVGVDSKELEEVLQPIPGEGIILRPYRPTAMPLDGVTDGLRQTGIENQEFSEIVDCLMRLGISGRMGRERLVVLANAGNKLAALELGELYYYGYITRNHKPDFQTACEWYKKAGDHPVALWSLGYCIMNNYYPVVDPSQIDYQAARDYFERTITITTETGISAAALTSIGTLWETGHYPAKDFAETRRCEKQNVKRALSYYKMADEMGYHYATNRLGLYYEKLGRMSQADSEENQKKAFSFFERSVSLVADGYALNKLGLYYENGFGCQINPAKACECYIRGVEEALQDDVTGWNYFNAGRVCANRIKQQPQSYYDLSRAFSYFDEALRKLPVDEHGQILLEMLDILMLNSSSEHMQAVLIIQTRAWIERYMSKFISTNDVQKEELKMMVRKKAQYLEELIPDKL